VIRFADLARRHSFRPNERRIVPRPLSARGAVTFGSRSRAGSSSVPPASSPESPTLAAQASAGISKTTPRPTLGFAALGDDNTVIPPDTDGAVGPGHLMVALNSEVRVQSRTGTDLGTMRLDDFWSSVTSNCGGGASCTFDPRVLYDRFGERWIFVAVAFPESPSSELLVGVSQNTDPTGMWNLYGLDVDNTDMLWADYPSVGFNKNWIAVQVNMFTNADDSFERGDLYAFDKADLYAAGPGAFTMFPDRNMFTEVPAVSYSSTQETLFLVKQLSAWRGTIRVDTLTGPVGTEILTVGPAIASGASWSSQPRGGVDFAPQLGSSHKIQNNDSRMESCLYRNRFVWCAQTIFLPRGGSPTRSAVQWWQLDTRTSPVSIRQRGRIQDRSGALFYAFPSIAVNKANDAFIGFSRFSASQYASASYAVQLRSDTRGSFQDDRVFKRGEASYYKTFVAFYPNRWGDYSSSWVDPVNDVDMWTIQEYAATHAPSPCAPDCSRWGTWWAELGLMPSITSFTPTSGRPGTVVTIRGWGFTGTTSVRFNGVAAHFTVDTWRRITATVPSGATDGPITIRTVRGSTTSAALFDVT
jgi:hypothetical protein